MSQQTGISYQRSQVTMADIKDGTSNTFLIGEKYINSDHYTDGNDYGDRKQCTAADDLELLRWTGINGTAMSTAIAITCPGRTGRRLGEGDHVQWFGSAHASGFNMSFCDGSVRSISYSIDGEVYRRLGNRKDGLPIDGSQF